MKITVIGSGNMGGALIKGWAKKNLQQLTITAKTQTTLDRYTTLFSNINTTLNNRSAVKEAEIIVLAVKPWLIPHIIEEIKDAIDFKKQIIISVAANIYTYTLRDLFDNQEADIFYVMPNIAAEFYESMTFIVPAENIEERKIKKVEELFLQLGKVKICSNKEVVAGNMLSGCGIAYIMRFLHAMMEGGVEMGLYPKDAQAIAMQAMKGAVAVLEGSDIHPALAIDKVTTPGGLTIRGLNELDHAGFNSAVIRCLKAGLDKN